MILPIRLGGVKDNFALEFQHLGDGQRHVLDADFVLFIDTERNGRRIDLVRPQDPDGEGRQVSCINELAERFPRPPNDQGLVLLLREVTFVNETGNDVAVRNGKVVVGAVNVGGDDGGKVAAVLFGIGPVERVEEALGVGVAFVGRVRGSVVEHGLVNGVGGLVGEDAGGEKGDELGDLVDPTTLHDIVVEENVLAKELDLLGQVGKETADLGGEVQHVGGLVLLKEGFRVGPDAEVAVAAREKDPGFVREFAALVLNVVLNGGADQARASRHENDARSRSR